MNAALKGLNNRVAPSGLTKEKGRLFPQGVALGYFIWPFQGYQISPRRRFQNPPLEQQATRLA
jgi:hypothetical protein